MYNVSMLAKDQVLALINDENLLNLTFDSVSFGVPTAAPGEAPERDTELVIEGIPGKGYKGTTTLLYNRIPLQAFEDAVPSAIQVEGDITLQNILNGFNAFYGSNLQLDDIRNDLTMPAELTSTPQQWTMIAAAGSYAYRGQVVLSIQAADVDLAVAVTKPVLDGLTLTM
jgi:hypothetical protein